MDEKKRDIFALALGVLFILSGLPKLISAQGAVDAFNSMHLSEAWRYTVGAIEAGCGVLMFVPALRKFGAFGFFCLTPAAFIVHITVGQYAMLPWPVVFGSVVFFYLYKRQIVRLM